MFYLTIMFGIFGLNVNWNCYLKSHLVPFFLIVVHYRQLVCDVYYDTDFKIYTQAFHVAVIL